MPTPKAPETGTARPPKPAGIKAKAGPERVYSVLEVLLEDYSGPSVLPRAKCDPKEAWATAAIAAPFVASGLQEDIAIQKAIRLVQHAAVALMKKGEEADKLRAESTPPLTLAGILAEFGLKRESTIREYLLATMHKDRADPIWKDAKKGEPAFIWWVLKELRGHREKIRTARADKAALGRKRAVLGRKKNVVK